MKFHDSLDRRRADRVWRRLFTGIPADFRPCPEIRSGRRCFRNSLRLGWVSAGLVLIIRALRTQDRRALDRAAGVVSRASAVERFRHRGGRPVWRTACWSRRSDFFVCAPLLLGAMLVVLRVRSVGGADDRHRRLIGDSCHFLQGTRRAFAVGPAADPGPGDATWTQSAPGFRADIRSICAGW